MATILLVGSTESSAVRELLESEGSWSVVEARRGSEALDLLEHETASLCVTDAELRDMAQEELLRELRRRHPGLPVVLLTSSSDAAVVRALRFGAASYVPRSSVARDLVNTVRRILELSEGRESEVSALSMRVWASARFELDNDAASFHPLVTHVMKELERFGFVRGNERVLAGVALEEALLNAMIHGNLEIDAAVRDRGYRVFEAAVEERRRKSPYRERRIRVELRLGCDEASIRVADEGPGFDARSLPDPLSPDNVVRSRGRGLLLMRSFMDEVRYSEKGNEVTLVKRRRRGA